MCHYNRNGRDERQWSRPYGCVSVLEKRRKSEKNGKYKRPENVRRAVKKPCRWSHVDKDDTDTGSTMKKKTGERVGTGVQQHFPTS